MWNPIASIVMDSLPSKKGRHNSRIHLKLQCLPKYHRTDWFHFSVTLSLHGDSTTERCSQNVVNCCWQRAVCRVRGCMGKVWCKVLDIMLLFPFSVPPELLKHTGGSGRIYVEDYYSISRLRYVMRRLQKLFFYVIKYLALGAKVV